MDKSDLTLFSGGCDNLVQGFRLSTQNSFVVGKHSAPVKCINFVPNYNMVITGSWDSSVNIWDLRLPNHTSATSILLAERVYAMDSLYPALIVATADSSKFFTYDLRMPHSVYKTYSSPFRHQIRYINCFPNHNDGFAVASVEGRVSIASHEQSITSTSGICPVDYTFKCHRTINTIHPVNWIGTHPEAQGVFVTGGGDGGWSAWNRQNKIRLYKPGTNENESVTSGDWMKVDGKEYLAIGYSYDWSKGVEFWEKNVKEREKKTFIKIVDIQRTNIRLV